MVSITKRALPGEYLTASDIPKRRTFKGRHLGNMKRAFKPIERRLNEWTVDDLAVTRRAIKRILGASGAITVAALCNSVRNHYKQNLRLKIDVGQSVVALRQLVAEGDVQRDGDEVWLTKFKDAREGGR